MNKLLRKLEITVDKLIPYLLLMLLFLIIVEIFFSHKIESYSIYVSRIDGIIITIFVLDLSFKFTHSKNIPNFLKKYWLEIIAVFPAFLVVRVVEEFVTIANLGETISISQEALEIGEKTAIKTSRLHYFSRFIRPLARFPRFLKAFNFYEKPTNRR